MSFPKTLRGGGSETYPIVRGKTESDCVDRFRDYQAGLLTKHMIHPNQTVRLFNTRTGVWGKMLQGPAATSAFRFKVPVGSIGVQGIADKLRGAGINAVAGTEHVNGIIKASDPQDAAAHLNKIMGWRQPFISDREIGNTIQRCASLPDRSAARVWVWGGCL